MSDSIRFALLFDGLNDTFAINKAFIFSPLFKVDLIKKELNMLNSQTVIFTSANGVRGFCLNVSRRNFNAFCVGKKTKQLALNFGFTIVESSQGESAKSLCYLIKEKCDPSFGPIYYARGEIISANLQDILQSNGFSVIEEVVYRQPQIIMKSKVKNDLEQGKIGGVVLFSARTAKLFLLAVGRLPSDFIFYCISNEVAKIIGSNLEKKSILCKVSEKPSSESLKNLITCDYNN